MYGDRDDHKVKQAEFDDLVKPLLKDTCQNGAVSQRPASVTLETAAGDLTLIKHEKLKTPNVIQLLCLHQH